ncbi:type II toxin-antitoxin system RelE/ParE family toxin [Tetragenococcus halophilus]|uniref:type II toxin-antitoxin system RelE/ParE family toxin n=1 Tax=Tetragenococcus halophilus TaxID=51669 RepID=UPI000CADB69C|nr:type II toxin-antitoxin system RelE/ParE family toxin [Tetragenococcus halophilus]MCO8285053.1 type II toxin-antitoxin system RelE/ParE family toxin [Tetragenococcus halophilus]GBD67055.1 hypothetical protein TEHN7116_2019 [Tetragenococcus halophilus subsp. halophilus]GBD78917.1 hypothetical protein TEHN7128_2146 [Tetragenococcus halophilus subsp. halophilus]
MKYRVQLTHELMWDLTELSDYLVINFSETLSMKVLSELFDIFDSLAEFPYSGKDASFLMFTFEGYMYLPLKKNVVFYTINEEKKAVTLLRLFSVNEDPIQKFKEYLE